MTRSPWIQADTKEEAEARFLADLDRHSKRRRLPAAERVVIVRVRRVAGCLRTWEVVYDA